MNEITKMLFDISRATDVLTEQDIKFYFEEIDSLCRRINCETGEFEALVANFLNVCHNTEIGFANKPILGYGWRDYGNNNGNVLFKLLFHNNRYLGNIIDLPRVQCFSNDKNKPCSFKEFLLEYAEANNYRNLSELYNAIYEKDITNKI